jgi:putative salt-induced outer membrane protein YdiY
MCLVVVSCLVGICRADDVKLKNGDRFTGDIIKSDAKALVLKTEFTGEVTVQWPAIQEINSSKPLFFELKDGKKISGPVHTEGGTLVVGSGTAATTVPMANVAVIRSQAEETAYEKTLQPSLLEQWKGGATVGFGLTSGNSQTEHLGLAFNAARKTLHDGITTYANYVYANAPKSTPSTTADTALAGIRYDRNFTPGAFGFGTADVQTDALQGLDPRLILGGGMGWHAIHNSGTTFDILGGIAYTHEHYFELTRNFPAALIGEELTQKVMKNTVITEKFYYAPDLTGATNYRLTFSAGTVTKISKWLGWQNAFGDIYVTNPPMGKLNNDLLFTTGLNVSFSH